MINLGIGLAIQFLQGNTSTLPFADKLLRFLRPHPDTYVYDTIGSLDAEEVSLNVFDMNPYNLSDASFELQVMNKDNLQIWSETDRNGLTIRDLPGYDPADPYRWMDDELDVDVFNTYINSNYTARVFANFFDVTTDLAVYNQQMSCQDSTTIHNSLVTGGWWILNRGVINGCGVIKADGVIWSK